jgi:hypothetical protein
MQMCGSREMIAVCLPQIKTLLMDKFMVVHCKAEQVAENSQQWRRATGSRGIFMK